MNRLKIEIRILLLILFVQLSGQTTPFHISSVIPLPPWDPVEQWDKMAVNTLGEYYLLDRETGQIIHISTNGEIIHTYGGIGLTQGGLAEPVAILVKDTQVIIADYSNNALVWLDRNLNWISNDVYPDLSPALMTKLSNEIVIYSYDQSKVYRRFTYGWDSTPFIDLILENSPLCLENIAGNRAGALATLACENRIITIYSALGRKEMQVPLGLPNAKFLIPFQNSWLLLNESGRYELLKDHSGQLPWETDRTIVDCAANPGQIIILTEHEIITFSY